ncbi:tyrosine-type recombinase/integrase [Dysgonomonas reticulitermitis]
MSFALSWDCLLLEGITHLARHTFATLLVLDGVDIYKIKEYLGHKSVTMTERYLKYDLSIAKESAKDIKTFG